MWVDFEPVCVLLWTCFTKHCKRCFIKVVQYLCDVPWHFPWTFSIIQPHNTYLLALNHCIVMFLTSMCGLISEHLYVCLEQQCFQLCIPPTTTVPSDITYNPLSQVACVWDRYKPEESSQWTPGSNRSLWPVGAESCLLPPCRGPEQCGRLFPHGTRCIIDGWLIGNSITQRLLGWQTLGHRYPVRTIELEHRRGGKVSFRDVSPLSVDLLGTPNGHSLVQSLTDDLPNNCSWSWAASWLGSAAQSSENLITG